MTRLYFKDMSEQELTKVYMRCEKVRESVQNDVREIADDRLRDVLWHCPKGCDYQIATYCQGEHFSIGGRYGDITVHLLDEVEQWMNDNEFTFYEILADAEFCERCEKMRKYQSVIEDVGYWSMKEKDYDYMDEFVSKTCRELEGRIYKALIEDYEANTSEEECLLYFCDEWGQNCFDGYYVENGNVYQEVHYTRMLTENASDFNLFA